MLVRLFYFISAGSCYLCYRMKHLPNILTLANLFCGCIAIAFILNSQPYVSSFNGEEYWVVGTEQAYWGAYFIMFAALFDVLDGLAARSLNIFSPIGKDLDSLADVVSFGVAPSMILFKMHVNMLAMCPAFIMACAGAVRLARFNVNTNPRKGYFSGLPIPAAGIVIASLPLINWYTPAIGAYFQNVWVIYLIIAVISWLMVSRIPFFKWMPASKNISAMWPHLVMAVVIIAGAFVLQAAIIPVALVAYVILSLINKPTEA
jgi:CDP-diacylglycerol--serine O-phosphatidyltransferase